MGLTQGRYLLWACSFNRVREHAACIPNMQFAASFQYVADCTQDYVACYSGMIQFPVGVELKWLPFMLTLTASTVYIIRYNTGLKIERKGL